MAISLKRTPQSINRRTTDRGILGGGCRIGREDFAQRLAPRPDHRTHLAEFGVLQQCLQELHMPMEIRRRHHGESVPGQGIVGVVPLGPLGAHPNATAWHQR